MKNIKIPVILFIFALVLSGCGVEENSVFDEDKTPIDAAQERETGQQAKSYAKATLKTLMGDIVLELYPQDAPKTVENFGLLAQSDFYDGVTFHRVIPDFMIQAGDPLSKDADPLNDGTGGPGYMFDDEINDHKMARGILAMANAGSNTNGSQFFIITAQATPWLDGKHTVFGAVTEGMEVVDAISLVERDARDRPLESVVIEDVLVE